MTQDKVWWGELTHAVERNDEKGVENLLARGADFNEQDEMGHDMLTLAVVRDYPRIARLIINAGADVNKAHFEKGDTPLMFAAYGGHAEIVRLLIDNGADINRCNRFGETALMEAARGYGSLVETVRLLIEKGADIEKRNNSGKTALECVAYFTEKEVIQILKDAPEIRRRAEEEARFQAEHTKAAERQIKLQKNLPHIKLKPGPQP